MFSRTAAILLAVLGLNLAAAPASAEPHGGEGERGGDHGGERGGERGGWGGGRGGWEGALGAGLLGLGLGLASRPPPRDGYEGRGWGPPPMQRGYPGRYGGRAYRSYPGPPPYANRSFTSPPVAGYPPPRGYSSGGEGRAAFDGDWRAQQNEVRQAVREGRHIPLSQAIEAVRRRAPGRELDAGLEAGPDGRSVYRLRWAGQNGRRQDYLVDAGTGAIVGVQGGP